MVGNAVRVKLAARDRDHLYKLRAALGATNPVLDSITKVQNKPFEQSYLAITSEQLAFRLASQGVVPNKSSVLEWPSHLPFELLRHYLRGYVDGDGGFYVYPVKGKPHHSPIFLFTFICSLPFAEGARRYLADAAGAYHSHVATHGGGMVTVRYAGRPQVRRVYQLLHEEATVYLPRKREKVAHLL